MNASIKFPAFIYGTAWKGATTAELVKKAIAVGFKAIDTANQPKHYNEPLVGEALGALMKTGVQRQDLFLQTKFTPVDGQDQRIPYDPHADFATQVQTSFQSSLQHLQTNYVDSYLLHGPYTQHGLTQADWDVWSAIEKIHASGAAKLIGISNVNVAQLKLLVSQAKIKPMVVQNRCYAIRGWDQEVREFCQANNIMYQGFSLLTANTSVLESKKILELAHRHHKTPSQIIFRFCIQLGMVPLTGTTSEDHMRQDLQVLEYQLTAEEVADIEKL